MAAAAQKIARLLTLEWSRVLQYRTDALLWMTAEATIPVISLAIWHSVAAASASGPAARDVLTYFVIVIIVKLATDAWNGVFMARDILNGDIVKDLMKPFPVFWRYVTDNIAEKALKLIVAVPLVIVLLIVFSEQFNPNIYEATRIGLFLISLFLALILAFVTDHLIGTLAFWLEDVFQIRRYKTIFEQLGTGIIIPFAFMPPLAVTLLSLLPFRYIVSAPVEILLNQPVDATVTQLLVIQIMWVAASLLLQVWLWRRGLKRYVVPGQ